MSAPASLRSPQVRISAPKPRSVLELLLRSDFGRLDPERARALMAGGVVKEQGRE